jgi:hypothetical protein
MLQAEYFLLGEREREREVGRALLGATGSSLVSRKEEVFIRREKKYA